MELEYSGSIILVMMASVLPPLYSAPGLPEYTSLASLRENFAYIFGKTLVDFEINRLKGDL